MEVTEEGREEEDEDNMEMKREIWRRERRENERRKGENSYIS